MIADFTHAHHHYWVKLVPSTPLPPIHADTSTEQIHTAFTSAVYLHVYYSHGVGVLRHQENSYATRLKSQPSVQHLERA